MLLKKMIRTSGPHIKLPTLAATTTATSITDGTASSGGNITNDGHSSITARGVCWNTGGTPTISDSKTTDGTGTGVFASSLISLTPGQGYYVRSYATNSVGTAYGTQVQFTTTSAYIIATGGTETTDGDYKMHTFTGSNSFDIDILGIPVVYRH